MTDKEKELLERIVKAVQAMPFGNHIALPWCRESFPELDDAIKQYEQYKNKVLKPRNKKESINEQ